MGSVDYKLTNTEEIRVNCPFCVKRGKTPDTKFHLYMNSRKEVYYCFRCGARGSFSSLPNDLIGIMLDTYSKLPLEKKEVNIRNVFETVYDVLNSLTDFQATDSSLIGELYLKQRLFENTSTSTDIPKKLYRILENKTNKSIWIIFFSYNIWGEIDYYTLRKIFSKVFLNPKFSKPLFKLDIFSAIEKKEVYLVEGIFDALSLYLSGIKNVFSLLGKELTDLQTEELLDYGFEKIYIVLDGDAISNEIKIANKLKGHFNEVFIGMLPYEKDPNDLRGNINNFIIPFNERVDFILKNKVFLEKNGIEVLNFIKEAG